MPIVISYKRRSRKPNQRVGKLKTYKMETKKCPICAESIEISAVKCPICGEILSTPQQMGDVVERIKGAIASLAAPKSKNLYTLEGISSEVLARHNKLYAKMGSDEKPLLLVNYKIVGSMGGYGWSGIAITDKNIYFKCVKDSFLSGIYAAATSGVMPLASVKSIAIGDHDHCYGTAYVGHQLVINGEVKGLLRMGGAILLDDELIENLAHIFNSISK